MKWQIIDDQKVRNIWACQEDDCPDYNKEICISPDWYARNGTPTCDCEVDMIYLRTEILTD